MRKIDFDNKTSWEILDIKNLIVRLISENYTIDRIQNLLGLTKFQVTKILEYQYNAENDFAPKPNDVTEEELMLGSYAYNYEDLSPSEKEIFNKLTND